jgi:hypothetical protein
MDDIALQGSWGFPDHEKSVFACLMSDCHDAADVAQWRFRMRETG